VVRVLVVLGVVVATTLTATPGAALHFDRACPQHVTKDTGARRRYVRCEHERIRPPGSFIYVLGIARCESGPDLMDTYTADGHGGPFQQDTSYWGQRFRSYTGKGRWPRDGELRNDAGAFRPNVLVSLRMARAKGTWQTDWSCA
jgi:hypothetical protein